MCQGLATRSLCTAKSRGAEDISCSSDELSNAVTTAGYSAPTAAQYQAFNSHVLEGGFATKRELAMFLAECIWESAGFTKKVEEDPVLGAYSMPALDVPGQEYFGRGYIQLTNSANYKAASEALFNDDRLLEDPGSVASNEDYAWQLSFWFWKTNVGSQAAVKSGMFGAATKAINGKIECSGGDSSVPMKRYAIYVSTLKALQVNETPQEGGCYN